MNHKGPVKALVLVAIILTAAYFLKTIPMTYGLDLKGGTRLVLELKDTDKIKVNSGVVRDVLEIMRNRVDGLGVTEPLLQVKGNRQLIVELPGIDDQQQAVSMLKSLAVLELRYIPSSYRIEMEESNSGKVDYRFFSDDKEVALADVIEGSELVVTGANLVRSKIAAEYDQMGNPEVRFALDREGTSKFADFTTRNVGKTIAIVLDGRVISAPVVKSPITGGEGVISGKFTLEEAQELAVLLKGGSLPVPVSVVENRTVGPTLGAESIAMSKIAGIVGVLSVLLFMVIYYRLPGLLADLALCIYLLLVMAVSAGLHVTLTLPGIAGIILSIGMAVDANVIIFERIKDELATGKTMRSAVDAGFRRAFAAIFDSNFTTLIAGAVLFIYGTGPIKGFAVTLSLGIAVSMFTAILITRYFMDLVASASHRNNNKAYFNTQGDTI